MKTTRTRYIAALSLIGMGVGFVVTLLLPYHPVTELLKGGFEAGLVGGFADWFAVTALFRHPLGIPIPHTSLLLKNRDKIARSLVSALENELLNKDSIKEKLKHFQLMKSVGSAVVRLAAKRSHRVGALKLLHALIARIPLESFAPSIRRAIAEAIKQADVQPLAGKAVQAVVRERMDERALDYALRQGGEWASRPETARMLGTIAMQKVSEAKVGGFMGFAVQAFAGFMSEDKLGAMIQQLLLSGIRDLLLPGNPNREKLLAEIRRQLSQAAGNEALLERGKAWILDQVEHPDSERLLLDRMESLRRSALSAIEREMERGGRKVVSALRYVVRKLQSEPETIEGIERRVLAFVADAVEANHYRIGLLIKDNIDKMNDKELVRMLEEKIGGDLQWIRVNGALCGFLIGLVLSGIQLLG
ncbi:DUF445 domain-containing protein [Cohnella hongkongensis]|uniref:DUF445 domain-containing protein n=1 Tax=Cohnella hongkongensis TaxID=178337 RepID=A0ABV9FHL4_9BACL